MYTFLFSIFLFLTSGLLLFISPAFAASTTNTRHQHGVLVIKYFPLTSDGQNIDITKTGDVGESYSTIRQRTIDVTDNLLEMIPESTKYKAFATSSAKLSIDLNLVDTKEYTQAVPMTTDGTRRPDYNGLLTSENICDYVNNQNVRQVFLWAYQGPLYPGTSYPYLNIAESKMSGPHGDISNSGRYNDMPQCNHTYRVYTLNYGRGTGEALHSWGHQVEAEMNAVDQNFFALFQGTPNSGSLNITGRCGSVHHPPNARSDYDYAYSTPNNSDCLDWQPGGLGSLSSISCSNWGCTDNGDADNPHLNYMIWNWQNMPGRNSNVTYNGKNVRNMWDIHGDFDGVMSQDKTMLLRYLKDPGTNVASGSAVMQYSSGNLNGTGWAFDNAFDGQTTSTSNSKGWSSGNSVSSSLFIDLGFEYEINKVKLYPVTTDSLGQFFPIDFKISVSNNMTSFTDVSTQTNYPQPTTSNGEEFTFTPVKARFIRIFSTNLRYQSLQSYAQFAEIEVYSTNSQTVALTPIADTYTDENTPNTSHGYDQLLWIKGGASPKKSYLRFDLSPLLGRTISAANLKLHTTTDSNSGSSGTQNIKYINDDLWTEFYMTHNNTINPSSIDATPIGTLSSTSSNQQYTVSLTTSKVQSKIGNALSILLESSSDDSLLIYPREKPNKPQLVITY